jgi:chromosome partitioning protein
MKTLLLHTPKGGSGKSTLCRELAVAFGAGAVLVDLDPQQTTAGWYARRTATAPALVAPEAARNPAALSRAGASIIVLDTPPGQFSALPGLLRQAAAVLVPVRPTPDDLLAAAPIAEALDGVARWAFVLTQVPTRSRLTEGAMRQLASLGRVAPVMIHFRADFPAAAVAGQAAVEFPGTKAAQEIEELRTYTLKLMRSA